MADVCMVVYHYYYRDSRLRRYAEGLATTGVPVDVLCLREPGQPQVEQSSNLRIHAVPASRVNEDIGRFLLAYTFGLIIYSIWLLALHIKNRYQVIHVHNMPDSLVLCALLPRLMGAKVILDIHDPMPEFYASKFQVQLDGTAVRLLRLHERLSTALAHAIITANGSFRDNLVQRDVPTEKITVINNLPDPTLFAPSQAVTRLADRQAFTLIYPGTIAPRYGLEVAIRALPQLVEEAAGIRLVLMGGAQPAYLQGLVQLAEQLGVAAHVTFRSPVPVDQVPMHLAQADVGIYPALPDSHMQIATPSKVLEYAAMGLPIVASRLKVLEDLFGDAAILFCEPGNVQQFAACIIELYRNPARGEELARQARLMVSDGHTWPQEQRRYYALLGQLTGSTLAGVATEETP